MIILTPGVTDRNLRRRFMYTSRDLAHDPDVLVLNQNLLFYRLLTDHQLSHMARKPIYISVARTLSASLLFSL